MKSQTKDIFKKANLIRDQFCEVAKVAKKTRDDALKEAEAGYKGNLLKQRLADIRKEYARMMDDARTNCMNDYLGASESVRTALKGRLKRLPLKDSATKDIVEALKMLDDLALSVDEVNAVVNDIMGDNPGYWVERAVSEFASRHGVLYSFQPDYGVKIACLDDLDSRVENFLSTYEDGGFIDDMHRVRLMRLEQAFTNNYAGMNLTAEKMAENITLETRSKNNLIEQAMFLSNSIKTCDPAVRREVCKRIADDPRFIEIINRAGVGKLIAEYQNDQLRIDKQKEELKRRLVEVDAKETEAVKEAFRYIHGAGYDDLDAMKRAIDGMSGDAIDSIVSESAFSSTFLKANVMREMSKDESQEAVNPA